MPHLFRLLLILSFVFLASGAPSAEPEFTLVSQDQIENGGLILPMGTVHPPELGWDWLVSDGIYVALPPEGGPDETLTVAYFQLSGGGSKEQIKVQLKKELLSESESPQAEQTFEIKDSSRPLFGEAFEATWKDADYFCSGIYTRAMGHTLLLLYQAPSREAADSGMTQVLESIKLSRDVAQAQAFESKADQFDPVRSFQLKDGRLKFSGGSITVPSDPAWTWKQKRLLGGTIFLGSRDGTNLLMIIHSRGELTRNEFVKGFLNGLTGRDESMHKDAFSYQASDLPFPGRSQRVQGEITLGGESLLKLDGYFGYDGKHTTGVFGLNEAVEENLVLPTVRSLQASSSRESTTLVAAFSILLGALCLMVCGLINLIAKRPVVNGGLIALVLTAVLALLATLPDLVRGDPGEMGYTFGSFLLPFLIFAYAHQRFKNKKQLFDDDLL